MTQDTERLFEAAASLPERERARLVMKLLDSIGGASAEIFKAQAGESVSRLAAMRSGDLDDLDSDEALRLIAD